MGGLTKSEATEDLKIRVEKDIPNPATISLLFENRIFDIPLGDLDLSYDVQGSVDKAYLAHREKGFHNQIIEVAKALFNRNYSPLVFNINELLLSEHLSVIADSVITQPVYPSITLEDGVVTVNPGRAGSDVDIVQLQKDILLNIANVNFEPIAISLSPIDPRLTETESVIYKTRGEKLADKVLILNFEEVESRLTSDGLLKLLDPKGGFDENTVDLLIENLKNEIETEPQNSIFVYEDGKVQEFSPAKDGVAIDNDKLSNSVVSSLKLLEEGTSAEIKIEIPVNRVSPSVTTEEVNDLGIEELLGKGSSTFRGSISSRLHNIELASKSFDGMLVKSGETFSFNNALGDVSLYTGYKQAYIIKDGKTVLGDGGGVCQVSTTLFRALLDAGLPITERRSHSYRVSYYEQDSGPGLDATVYAPTTDLKFVNDTPAHLLIQTAYDPSSLTLEFEIYGTSDGRVATVTKPVITSQSPPPEDLYQDDPSLPQGTVKQIERSAWGAKVSFEYKVEREGEIIEEKTFYSNYRPWQAVFLQGTGPVI